MQIDTDNLVTQILVSATDLGSLIQHTKERDAAIYFQGGRDTLLALAKALKQSCSLAVDLFNTPVTVTKEEQDGL